MAIESTSSSPVSAKTDEVAFLEAARALCCASGLILVEIASNQCTKLLIGGGGVPVLSVLLASPPDHLPVLLLFSITPRFWGY